MRAARESLDGVRAAFVAFCIFGAFLVSVSALTTLVATLEAGGSTLSGATVLASAAFLMSEGSTVRWDSLRLGLMPLGLTLMLVLILGAIIRRHGASPWGLLSGLATWSVLHVAMINLSHITTEQQTAWSIVFADVCYLAGFLVAVRPRIMESQWIADRMAAILPAAVRSMLSRSVSFACRATAAYLLAGLITVIVWVIRDRDTVVQLFILARMPMGSRITTSFISLAWLPNVMLWAIAWLFGAGFHIGRIAAYSLWSATSTGLPPIPVFGAFPDAVADDDRRMLLLCVPVLLSAIMAIVDMFIEHRPELMSPIGTMQHVRRTAGPGGREHQGADAGADKDPGMTGPSQQDATGAANPLIVLVLRLLVPLLVLGLGSAMLVIIFLALFALGNGTLGLVRLDGVGVDLAAALQSVGRPTLAGCGFAWLIAVLVLSARYGWTVFRESKSTDGSRAKGKDDRSAMSPQSDASSAPRSGRPSIRSGRKPGQRKAAKSGKARKVRKQPNAKRRLAAGTAGTANAPHAAQRGGARRTVSSSGMAGRTAGGGVRSASGNTIHGNTLEGNSVEGDKS